MIFIIWKSSWDPFWASRWAPGGRVESPGTPRDFPGPVLSPKKDLQIVIRGCRSLLGKSKFLMPLIRPVTCMLLLLSSKIIAKQLIKPRQIWTNLIEKREHRWEINRNLSKLTKKEAEGGGAAAPRLRAGAACLARRRRARRPHPFQTVIISLSSSLSSFSSSVFFDCELKA